MNVAMLSTLVAIVDRGSFAAAAQQDGCTPSAVSLQMKQLEAWFGQLLFNRSARTARPMPFALEAAAVARDFSARCARAARRCGPRRLGAIDVQTRLRRAAAGIVIPRSMSKSCSATPMRCCGELKAGRIDAAVLVRPQSGGSSRLSWRNLAMQPFVLLAPPGRPAGRTICCSAST